MTTETKDHTGAGRIDLSARPDARITAIARLAIGLIQGVALYLLMRTTEGAAPTWSSQNPEVFAPMLLVALFLPPVLLAGVGRLRMVTFAIWSVVAAAFLAFLAWHDIVRQAGETLQPTFALFPASATALFIAHHLIVPADRERRLVAAYPTYFDTAWMAGVQLALSVGFAGAFWLLLLLGAALFSVIGLAFLGELIQQSWFALPLTGLAFAAAVQLTDVRDGLIRGVRTVALMLLSWLLLVLTVLVGAFVLALPFTGLQGLWETNFATALVLAAAGAMIVLINAAYQDGRDDNLPPAVLRIAVRVASVLLIPLVGIAIWGLALRIGQHGLTPDRIIAVACTLVGALYAGGYAWAALQPFITKDGDWMKPLERTNVYAAALEVVVILALFSPVADPARLSVADQVARLNSGKVAPDDFDYAFLKFESGKVGEAALARLMNSTDPGIATKAREAQASDNLGDMIEDREPAARPIVVDSIRAGAVLPTDFLKDRTLRDLPNCNAPGECVGVERDLDNDGTAEILIAGRSAIVLFAKAETGWWQVGSYSSGRCSPPTNVDFRHALRSGAVVPTAPRMPDLEILGQRAEMAPSLDCLDRSLPPAR